MKSTRHTQRTVRGLAALALAAALGLTVSACGSDHADHTDGAARSGSSAPGSTPATSAGSPSGGQRTSGAPLATLRGPDGIVITLTSAVRSAGGFVTVNGTVSNTGSQPFTQAEAWRGNEEALVKNGGSLAGATLVDPAGKKRYYVLRDTDGRCLCTTGLDIIRAGATLPVYAQFPAPPATVTQVDFDLPTLPTASIVISQ